MSAKKFIVAAAFAAVALFSGINAYNKSNEVKLSDLALANVEALANNESGDGIYCRMHLRCYDSSGNFTGNYSASSYTGPGCNKSYHSHLCSSCSH